MWQTFYFDTEGETGRERDEEKRRKRQSLPYFNINIVGYDSYFYLNTTFPREIPAVLVGFPRRRIRKASAAPGPFGL